MKLTGKLTIAVICAAMAASLASCGQDETSDSTSANTSEAAVTTSAAEDASTTEGSKSTTTAKTEKNTEKTTTTAVVNENDPEAEKETWYLGDWYLNGADYLDMLRFEKDNKWSLYNDGGNGNLIVRGTYDASNLYAIKLYDDYYDDASMNTHALVGEAHQGQYGITLFVDDGYDALSYLYKDKYDNQPVFLREGDLAEGFFEAHDPNSERGDIAELTDREALDELCKVVNANSYRLDGEDELNGIKVYLFSVGDSNDEQFVATAHYAVTIYGIIYVMDPLTGEYVNY